MTVAQDRDLDEFTALHLAHVLIRIGRHVNRQRVDRESRLARYDRCIERCGQCGAWTMRPRACTACRIEVAA